MGQIARRPTIRDVASRAGVSTTTVSNALNGRGRLPVETRDRVVDVAREMGYRARASARALQRGRSGQIGLLSPALSDADSLVGSGYYIDLALGAARGALAQDHALVLLPPAITLDRLSTLDVDGFIVSDPPRADPAVAAIAATGAAIVTCERDLTPGLTHAGCVRNDHRSALSGLLDHLAERGARHIAMLVPGHELAWSAELSETYALWCAHRDVQPVQVQIPTTPGPEYALSALAQVLDRGPVDAIVCAQDEGAATIVRELDNRGVRVPEDVLVASCVDGGLVAAANPPVTAIDLKPAAIGQRAAELLTRILLGDDVDGTEIEVPTELIIRASTEPVRP